MAQKPASFGDHSMEQGQWQVGGSAPEVYERETWSRLVLAIGSHTVELAPPRPATARIDCREGGDKPPLRPLFEEGRHQQ